MTKLMEERIAVVSFVTPIPKSRIYGALVPYQGLSSGIMIISTEIVDS